MRGRCTVSAIGVISAKLVYATRNAPTPSVIGAKRKAGGKLTTTQVVGPSLMAAWAMPKKALSLKQLAKTTCCVRRKCLKVKLTAAGLKNFRERLEEANSGNVLHTKREVAHDLIHHHGYCNRAVEMVFGQRR